MKKIIYLLFMFLLLPLKVGAIHDVIDVRCTNDLKVSLREEGQDVVYRLSKVLNGSDVSYTAYFYNLTENIYLTDSNDNVYLNSKIENLKPGSTLTVNMYASNKTYCNGYKILTKVINVPYYNPYFGSELCSGYENYSLCNENTNVTLSQDEFEKKINEYKESLKEEKEEVVDEIVEEEINSMDLIVRYKYYILGGIALIAIVMAIVAIKKNRKERGIL